MTNRPLEARFVFDAAKEYAPGPRIPECPPAEDPPLWHRLLSGITGITLVSAILAIAFGVLALVNIGLADAQRSTLLDIAKLLAGAIVGSTGAAVAIGAKRP